MQHYIAGMTKAIKAQYPDNDIIADLWDWAQQYEDDGVENLVAWSLEDCNCSGCHAPGGLIYNNEIAAKYVDWWDVIDEAMDAYHDATGERFTPETTGQLVWFAVEWFANELAGFLRSHNDWDEWESQTDDPDEEEFVKRFYDEIAPMVIEQYGENDEPAMNEAFCNWVDALNRDGEISDYFANEVTL